MPSENLKYYSASFGWTVPKDLIPKSWEEHEKEHPNDTDGWHTPVMSPIEDSAGWEVGCFVSDTLTELKLDSRHAYLYPDGSCCNYIHNALPIDELRQKITTALIERGPWNVYLANLHEVSGDDKAFGNTIAQRFGEAP